MEEEITSSPFSTTNSTDDPDFKPSEGGGGCNNENLSWVCFLPTLLIGYSSSSSVNSQFYARPSHLLSNVINPYRVSY